MPATLQHLPQMLLWIQQILDSTQLPGSVKRRTELSLEEALVNIINHAYSDEEGEIEVSYFSNDEAIEFIVVDKGAPFNPLVQEENIVKNCSLEEMSEGGLGIPLIQKFTDELSYERSDGKNILKLKTRY